MKEGQNNPSPSRLRPGDEVMNLVDSFANGTVHRCNQGGPWRPDDAQARSKGAVLDPGNE